MKSIPITCDWNAKITSVQELTPDENEWLLENVDDFIDSYYATSEAIRNVFCSGLDGVNRPVGIGDGVEMPVTSFLWIVAVSPKYAGYWADTTEVEARYIATHSPSHEWRELATYVADHTLDACKAFYVRNMAEGFAFAGPKHVAEFFNSGAGLQTPGPRPDSVPSPAEVLVELAQPKHAYLWSQVTVEDLEKASRSSDEKVRELAVLVLPLIQTEADV